MHLSFFFQIMHREGNMEHQIQQPKKVLQSMRRTMSFYMTKLTLLCRLWNLSWIERSYSDTDEDIRDWFKGHHVYETSNMVIEKFKAGDEPISCFCLKDDTNMVHVAFYPGDRDQIGYISFTYNIDQMFVEEIGIHFCKFQCLSNIVVANKVETKRNMDRHALMLPYRLDSARFDHQYTLVYSDWEVMVNDNGSKNSKGVPLVSGKEFSDEYFDCISNIPPL